MAEDTPESRRGFLKKVLAVGTLALGLKGVEAVVSAKPKLIVDAEENLNSPKREKSDYRIRDDEEIRRQHGAAVRDYPRATLPGEEPNLIKTLQPGEIITGGIEAFGKSAINSTIQEPVNEWVAFKNPDGRTAFIHRGNVEKIPK